jgi:DNA-binding beta-propeller fold protein YncE
MKSNGVMVTNVTGALISSFYTRIRFASDRVYATSGEIIDAQRRVRVGTFASGGEAIAPDPALGRAYVLNGNTITAFDLNTFQQLGAVTFTRVNVEHPALSRMKLVRWGTDGLAFRDGAKVYILRTTLAAP